MRSSAEISRGRWPVQLIYPGRWFSRGRLLEEKNYTAAVAVHVVARETQIAAADEFGEIFVAVELEGSEIVGDFGAGGGVGIPHVFVGVLEREELVPGSLLYEML